MVGKESHCRSTHVIPFAPESGIDLAFSESGGGSNVCHIPAERVLDEELAEAFDLLEVHPQTGETVANARLRGVRRLLIGRTGYFLYYRAHANGIEIIALWHASRGRGPAL